MTSVLLQLIFVGAIIILGVFVFLVRGPLSKMSGFGQERWWLEKKEIDPVSYSRRKLTAVGVFLIGLGTIVFVSGADHDWNSSLSFFGRTIIGILLLGLFLTFILYVFSVKKVI